MGDKICKHLYLKTTIRRWNMNEIRKKRAVAVGDRKRKEVMFRK